MFIKIVNNSQEAPVIYLRYKWKIHLGSSCLSSLSHPAGHGALSCSAKDMQIHTGHGVKRFKRSSLNVSVQNHLPFHEPLRYMRLQVCSFSEEARTFGYFMKRSTYEILMGQLHDQQWYLYDEEVLRTVTGLQQSPPGCSWLATFLQLKDTAFMMLSCRREKCLTVTCHMEQGQCFEGVLLFGKLASRGESPMTQTAARTARE